MTHSLILQSGFVGTATGLLIVLIVLLWKKESVSRCPNVLLKAGVNGIPARLRRMRGQFLDGAIPVGADSERGASAGLCLRAVVRRRNGIQYMFGKGTVVAGDPEYVAKELL